MFQIESNELFETAFNALIRASVDKKSDARNVVVSISDGEYPSSRIMVLREVNVREKSFTFFSDSNSQKCKLIDLNPRGSLTVWDRKTIFKLESEVNLFSIRILSGIGTD